MVPSGPGETLRDEALNWLARHACGMRGRDRGNARPKVADVFFARVAPRSLQARN